MVAALSHHAPNSLCSPVKDFRGAFCSKRQASIIGKGIDIVALETPFAAGSLVVGRVNGNGTIRVTEVNFFHVIPRLECTYRIIKGLESKLVFGYVIIDCMPIWSTAIMNKAYLSRIRLGNSF